MPDDAGETERLPKRAWGHRRQTCHREKRISGDGVAGSMDGASRSALNPGKFSGKLDLVPASAQFRAGGNRSVKEQQECLLLTSWSATGANARVTRRRVRRCNRARRSAVFVRAFIRRRQRSRIPRCAKLL